MKRYVANSQLKLLFLVAIIGFALYYANDKFNFISVEPVKDEEDISSDLDVKYETKRVKVVKESGEEFPIEVYIADDQEKRTEGLSVFSEISTNQGMLFEFTEDSLQGFWMKDVKYSLDIAFVNAQKEIIYLKKSADTCLEGNCTVYSPNQAYRYVLEANAGWFDNRGLGEGDKLDF